MDIHIIKIFTFMIVALSCIQCNPFVTVKSKSVIYSTKEYYDSGRNRKIKIYIWQPSSGISTNDRSLPLVIFSHGTEGSSDNYSWFTVAMAEKGYIVVGVDHYNNTWYRHTLEGAVALWDRPLDISFVLTELLQDNSFSRKINKEKIAAAGHSAGGYTALALAGAIYKLELMNSYCVKNKNALDCKIGKGVSIDFFRKNINNAKKLYKDPRIKAVFAMEPALGGGIDIESLKKITVPVCIVGSKQNDFLIYNDNAYRYSENILKSKLVTLAKGEGHFIFIDKCTVLGNLILRQICNDRDGIDRNNVHREIIKVAQQFFFDCFNM